MIIYCILNVINFHCYVGQTIQSFNGRYHKGEWWRISRNQYLKCSVKSHGLENFIVLILEENVESIEKLNELEEYYIQQCNSLYPHGFNFDKGGRNSETHLETRKKHSYTKREIKNLKFRSPMGEIFEPDILRVFCQEHGLHDGHMSNLARGYNSKGQPVYSVSGWTNANRIVEERVFISPWGEIFTIKNIMPNLANFYRQHNLADKHMASVWFERANSHKGWKKYKK